MAESAPKLALRPLELKQFFDFSIRIYRGNFIPMLLLTALLQMPLSLLATALLYNFSQMSAQLQRMAPAPNASPADVFGSLNMDNWLWLGLGGFFVMVWMVALLPLVHVAIARLVACAVLGEPCTAQQALRFASARYWATQAALAAFVLPVLLVALLMLLPLAALSSSPGAVAVTSGLGIMLIFGGLIATWLYYFRYFGALCGAIQAVEEPQLAGAANQGVWYLKRSYALTGGYFGRVLGLSLLLTFALGFIQNGLTNSIRILLTLIYLASNLPQKGDILTPLISSSDNPTVIALTLVLASLFALLYPGIQLCYQVLLYFDLRFRKEGLDLQLVLDELPKPQAAATYAAP